MLLSTILMIVTSVMDVSACEHMSPPGSSNEHVLAFPMQKGSTFTAIAKDSAELAQSILHDVDGCIPQCCQHNVCCYVVTTSSIIAVWSERSDDVVALLSTDGTIRSTEPDVPPPKAA